MQERGKVAFRIVVTGSVQGVGFRAFTVSLARRNGITGSVMNDEDGSVAIIAEGEARSIDRFVEGLKEGNGWSRTDRVSLTEIRPMGFTSFEVAF
ncbi:MAG TPA: acylphosphatase [Treponemataceae bacterium]|nr:acylphosphatase [Treponemataceae bacterium]HPS44238.1 acylphosphatase [Treponemataceae bacterium]